MARGSCQVGRKFLVEFQSSIPSGIWLVGMEEEEIARRL
jgi:hypothetical protein